MWRAQRFDHGHDIDLDAQGQIWNLLYLNQSGPIATKCKTNISIEF